MTDRQAKEFVMQRYGYAGWVCWCKRPPWGIGFYAYKFTLLEAIAEGFRFIGGERGDAVLPTEGRLAVGREWAELIAILPSFVACIIYLVPTKQQLIGHINDLDIWYDPGLTRRDAVLYSRGEKVLLNVCD